MMAEFAPIDLLSRADADIYLVFLSGNGVIFTEYTDDVWYNLSATATDVPYSTEDGIATEKFLLPQAAASPLGCTNRYQFCVNQKAGDCGPLASLNDAIAGAVALFNTTYAEINENTATSEKAARFIYFVNTFFSFNRDVAGVLRQLGSRALLSRQTLYGGIQGALASNQWQLDVSHWWNISMAIAQAVYLDCAYGHGYPALVDFRLNYTGPEFDNVCRNQARIPY